MRILLTGASGQLGTYLIDRLIDRGHDLVAWSGSTAGRRGDVAIEPVDLADRSAVESGLDAIDPDAILHAAAVSSAEAVRLDPDRARAINVDATRLLAGFGRRLVFTSTDLVFDGSRAWNRESDPADPILAYGRTKREAEETVIASPMGVVARLPLLYGPSRCGRPYFFTRAIDAMTRGEPQTFFDDEFRTPLDLATAADVLVRLAEAQVTGLYHVGGPERMSRFDLMRRAATATGLDPGLVLANRMADVNLAEARPRDVSLDSSRLMASFPDLTRRTVEESLSVGESGTFPPRRSDLS